MRSLRRALRGKPSGQDALMQGLYTASGLLRQALLTLLYRLAQHGFELFRCDSSRVAEVDFVVFAIFHVSIVRDEVAVHLGQNRPLVVV